MHRLNNVTILVSSNRVPVSMKNSPNSGYLPLILRTTRHLLKSIHFL